MPKINVYLPDELAAAVRESGVSVSAICQRALAEAVRESSAAREAMAALRGAEFAGAAQDRAVGWLLPRLTPRLRRALARAVALGGEVGGEQLLAALLDDGENLGARVLRMLGVDVAALRAATGVPSSADAEGQPADVGGLSPRGEGTPAHEQLLRGLPLAAREVLASAVEEAQDQEHSFLGCEHLLLGIAAEEGGAGRLLRAAGAAPEAIRRTAAVALKSIAAGRPVPPQAEEQRLTELERRLADVEQRLSAGGL